MSPGALLRGNRLSPPLDWQQPPEFTNHPAQRDVDGSERDEASRFGRGEIHNTKTVTGRNAATPPTQITSTQPSISRAPIKPASMITKRIPGTRSTRTQGSPRVLLKRPIALDGSATSALLTKRSVLPTRGRDRIRER